MYIHFDNVRNGTVRTKMSTFGWPLIPIITELHLESSDTLGERKPQPLVETQKNLENLKQTPDTFSESQIWLFGSAV